MFAFTSIKSELPHDAENALENTLTIFTPVTEEIIITSNADSNEGENSEQKCKRKRTFFPLEYKLNILNELKDSKTSEVSLKYNISQRTIRKWKIKEHDLRYTFSNMKKETNFDAIDSAVYAWFKDITDQGLRVKSSEIKSMYFESYLTFLLINKYIFTTKLEYSDNIQEKCPDVNLFLK